MVHGLETKNVYRANIAFHSQQKIGDWLIGDEQGVVEKLAFFWCRLLLVCFEAFLISLEDAANEIGVLIGDALAFDAALCAGGGLFELFVDGCVGSRNR